MKFWFNESFSNHKYVWLYQDSLKIQDKNCINLPMQLVYMSELGFWRRICPMIWRQMMQLVYMSELGFQPLRERPAGAPGCNLYIWVNWDKEKKISGAMNRDATCMYEWIGISTIHINIKFNINQKILYLANSGKKIH